MKIVIDCFKLVKGAGKSIGIYNLALNLVRNLVQEKAISNDVLIQDAELLVLGNSANYDDFGIDGVEFVKIESLDPLNKIHCLWWELFHVSSVCKKLNADCVIFPRGYCGLTHPVSDLIIIHDLIPFYYDEHFPGVFNKVENAYIMYRLKQSARTCEKVVTISQASKDDIIKYCRVGQEKIKVINNGCNYVQDVDYGEKLNYISAMTSGLPHKNAVGILKAYERYCRFADNPIELKIIGIEDTSCLELPDDIKSRITCYKYIKDDSELYKIIAQSKVFVFLSLIEGFGFPPIEAMQLGVPVICSNVSSLPEVVGNAAVLVNPDDSDEVATKINELVCNKSQRDMLVLAGKTNVKRFSWDNVAKEYWKVILEVAVRGGYSLDVIFISAYDAVPKGVAA